MMRSPDQRSMPQPGQAGAVLGDHLEAGCAGMGCHANRQAGAEQQIRAGPGPPGQQHPEHQAY